MIRGSIFLLAIAVSALQSQLQAGDGAGNGGGAWVCQNGDRSTRWIRLVDLYEAEHTWSLSVRKFEGMDYGEILTTVSEQSAYFFNGDVHRTVMFNLENIEERREDITGDLSSINDLYPTVETRRAIPFPPEECPMGSISYVQLANFTENGTILINQRFFNDPALSEVDKAALMFHEAVYEFLRTKGETDSYNTRRIVGYAFSDLDDGAIHKNIDDILNGGEESEKEYGEMSAEERLWDAINRADVLDIYRILGRSPDLDVNTADSGGKTPLMFATTLPRAGLMRSLLRAGADVNARTESGWTALIYAVFMGRLDRVVALIEAGSDVNARTDDFLGKTPLIIAAEEGHFDILERLIAAGAELDAEDSENHYTALRYTIERGDVEAAAALVDAGAEVNRTNGYSFDAPLVLAIRRGDVDMVLMLIGRGADVNRVGYSRSQSAERWTPLIYATREENANSAIVAALLTAGARTDVVAARRTPLMNAAFHGNAEVASLLIIAGADVNAKVYDPRPEITITPIILAARSGDTATVEVLIRAGADVNARTSSLYGMHETPLMHASRYGDAEMVDRLIEAGADVNARNDYGWTPLMFASTRIGEDENGSPVSLSIVETLIRHGADVNTASTATLSLYKRHYTHTHVAGKTALMIAAEVGYPSVFRSLVRAGAMRDAQDIHGKSADEYRRR